MNFVYTVLSLNQGGGSDLVNVSYNIYLLKYYTYVVFSSNCLELFEILITKNYSIHMS